MTFSFWAPSSYFLQYFLYTNLFILHLSIAVKEKWLTKAAGTDCKISTKRHLFMLVGQLRSSFANRQLVKVLRWNYSFLRAVIRSTVWETFWLVSGTKCLSERFQRGELRRRLAKYQGPIRVQSASTQVFLNVQPHVQRWHGHAFVTTAGFKDHVATQQVGKYLTHKSTVVVTSSTSCHLYVRTNGGTELHCIRAV